MTTVPLVGEFIVISLPEVAAPVFDANANTKTHATKPMARSLDQ